MKIDPSIPVLRARIRKLEAALDVIAKGTICPDLFPGITDEWELQARTAMVSALAVLEVSTPADRGKRP
jgi:hypothetical protein